MRTAAVLLVSRDQALARSVQEAVRAVGRLRVQTAATAAEARATLRQPQLALVLAHLADRGDDDGIADLMRGIVAGQRAVATVVIGEPGRAEQGLALLRQGAAEYLERPLNLHRLAYLLDALTVRACHRPIGADEEPQASARTSPDKDFHYSPSEAMGRVMDLVRRVAPVGTNVLLLGETGTGKTRLARIIHDLSPRRDQPFLVVNCAALSANLIESEMFGHVKGAFTGAGRDRDGKFADVGGGTLLLDEIDSLPVELQAKLLRAVDDRVFEPVGSNRPLPVQARLIAASNRDLDQEAKAGRFRSDLYFRLNVVSFHLPPLRERPDILPAMVAQFVREFAGRAGRDIPGVTPEALAALQAYDWPGNIRELRNAIERAVALRLGGAIGLDDLPPAVGAGAGWESPAAVVAPTDSTLARTKEAAEAARITEALLRNRNNRLRAAAELGISRMTLYKKLHRYGLTGATG
jgi:DNA-binding NtrC family response regulator